MKIVKTLHDIIKHGEEYLEEHQQEVLRLIQKKGGGKNVCKLITTALTLNKHRNFPIDDDSNGDDGNGDDNNNDKSNNDNSDNDDDTVGTETSLDLDSGDDIINDDGDDVDFQFYHKNGTSPNVNRIPEDYIIFCRLGQTVINPLHYKKFAGNLRMNRIIQDYIIENGSVKGEGPGYRVDEKNKYDKMIQVSIDIHNYCIGEHIIISSQYSLHSLFRKLLRFSEKKKVMCSG